MERSYLKLIILVLILGASCMRSNPSNEEVFSVTLTPLADSYSKDLFNGEQISIIEVSIELKNTSNNNQKFNLMTCSWWDSFVIEPANFLYFNWGCDSNWPKEITLKTGQAITFNSKIGTFDTMVSDINLRTGFIRLSTSELRPPIIRDSITLNNKIYWSNRIKIKGK
jgi:hypothetical protein